ANLYAPPLKRRKGQRGRPRVKGPKLPSPAWTVARSEPTPASVGWYGGGDRQVAFVSRTSHWYKGGGGLVELRWVFVGDRQGTHRDQYFYCTDPGLTPQQIITLYTTRWGIEVTFQEAKAHLGFETTRQHCRNSVTRAAPCLLGLYSLVTLIYKRLIERRKPIVRQTAAYAKTEPTFSDALYAVRRVLWAQTILKQPAHAAAVSKLPARFRTFMLDQLAATG